MDEGLLHKKLRTLEQQRAQSDDLNALLTREGGLNESQYMTCKNLTTSRNTVFYAVVKKNISLECL